MEKLFIYAHFISKRTGKTPLIFMKHSLFIQLFIIKLKHMKIPIEIINVTCCYFTNRQLVENVEMFPDVWFSFWVEILYKINKKISKWFRPNLTSD